MSPVRRLLPLLAAPFLPALALVACSSTPEPVRPVPVDLSPVPADPHSAARPNDVRVTHVDLDLELDFEERRVEGVATLHVARLSERAVLVLDTHELAVRGVTGPDGRPREWRLAGERGRLGSALEVRLEPEDTTVSVAYASDPSAEALQWLDPAQTAGGEQPFLFTQGQAILTRSWIPLQDSPGVRVTWSAAITAPAPLTVVMSGEARGVDDAPGETGARTWRYGLDLPVPSYLIALGCGDLERVELSDRAAVWAEPSVVEAAAWEFADTESMIRAAEDLFGPYRWGRYDVLVLPPSFPFGGMENPLLTFATPTILAGDRSLVALVAHELAHSWSGNLVTNATWRDFWLNEGFTVYFEKRIMERIYGADRARMEMVLDRADLEEEIADLEPWQTVLAIDLEGHHPDDGFSGVPYEKGALFLRRIEEVVGRERLDAFLTEWFDGHAFRSVTTDQLLAFLEAELVTREELAGAGMDLDAWVHGEGLPADAPTYDSEALAAVDAVLARFLAGAPAGGLDTEGWVTQQWLRFLDGLPDDLPAARLADLDAAFDLTGTGNSEVLCLWLQQAIRSGYAAADPRLESFLMTVGRRKFLSPIYRTLCETEAGRERARTIYAAARPRYHSVSSTTLDGIVRPAGGASGGANE